MFLHIILFGSSPVALPGCAYSPLSDAGLRAVFGRVDVEGAHNADIAKGKLDVRIPCAALLVPTSMDSTWLSEGTGRIFAVAPMVAEVVEDGSEERARNKGFL